jgi:hypothetical protein
VIRAGVLVVAAVLGAAAPVDAEHEVYYRYVLLGYVKDATGTPLPDRNVEVVRDRTGFSYLADTDVEGFYVVVTRLGDESAGEQLTVKVGSATTTVTARFDPANHTDARGTRVDLDGAQFRERASWFPSTLARFLGAPVR